MKKVPKYIKNDIVRMSKLMGELTDLNIKLENWLESNGIEDGFDFTYDYRYEPAYEIINIEDFIQHVEETIN